MSSTIEILCYLVMIILTAMTALMENVVPLHLNIAVFSMSIIISGCYRSLSEAIQEMHKVHILGKKGDSIETMTSSDAMQFPFVAGGVLCCLYGLIKYYGKEAVNHCLLVYIAIGSTTSIRALLVDVLGLSFLKGLEETKLVNIHN